MAETLRFCPYCGSRLLIEAQRFWATCGRPTTAAAGGPGAVVAAAASPLVSAHRPAWRRTRNPLQPSRCPPAPVAPTTEPAVDVGPATVADHPAADAAMSATAAGTGTFGASAAGPGLPSQPATGLATSMRPAHWALAALIALALGAVFPWLTSFLVSFSPLQLMGQNGYWLAVVLVAVASVALAVAKVSTPPREASQVLWAWLWLMFGGAALLAALYLVALSSARSEGGFGGIAVSSAGMGAGYLLFAAGAIGGFAVSIRAWRSLRRIP